MIHFFYTIMILSDSEKSVIINYLGGPTHDLAKDPHSDKMIIKGIATMTTNNRVALTDKGLKIQKWLKRLKYISW